MADAEKVACNAQNGHVKVNGRDLAQPQCKGRAERHDTHEGDAERLQAGSFSKY